MRKNGLRICRGSLVQYFGAPWVPLCRYWKDYGLTRERGLAIDRHAVRRSDGVLAVGGRKTAGMLQEVSAAKESFLAADFISFDDLKRNTRVLNAIHNWLQCIERKLDAE